MATFKFLQASLDLEKPKSIEEVYKLLANLHTHDLRKTHLIGSDATIDHTFSVLRITPIDVPNISILCSLDRDAPYYLACYNFSTLMWQWSMNTNERA